MLESHSIGAASHSIGAASHSIGAASHSIAYCRYNPLASLHANSDDDDEGRESRVEARRGSRGEARGGAQTERVMIRREGVGEEVSAEVQRAYGSRGGT
jgi:hypothetical protein